MGMGQPLFSFQDQLGAILRSPLVPRRVPQPWQPGGEELRGIAKQAPGIPAPEPRVGAGTRSGRSSQERAPSLRPASPRAAGLMSCGPICLGRMVLPPARRLQGWRWSQRDVRRRLQALPRSPFLGAAAALVCAPVRVVPQICTGESAGAA